jgi:hypothetical protein
VKRGIDRIGVIEGLIDAEVGSILERSPMLAGATSHFYDIRWFGQAWTGEYDSCEN